MKRLSVFALLCWVISRLVVLHGLHSVAHPNFGVVTNWDGVWYRTIATRGYDFAADGRWHSIAFFPLYPWIVSLALRVGVNFDVASALVSNAAYLAMMIVTSHWVAERNGCSAARWTSAFLAFFPLSLFGSVAYPEGLFMLLSALALRDFDARRYPASALWSALAALTRPNGVVLCVAFAVSALAERRGKGALLPAVAALLGALVMIAIGAVRFHDPLAFVHAQQAWRHGIGGGFTEWRILLSSGSVSFGHWRLNLYMLPIIALLILAGTRIHWAGRLCLWSVVVAVEHLCWGRDFPFAVIALLGGAAVIAFRRQLGSALVVYACVSLCVLLASGSSMSADRFVFGVLPFSLAVGLLLERNPYLGLPLIAVDALDLVRSAAAFARSAWVA